MHVTYLDGARPWPSVRPEREVGNGLASVEGRRDGAVPPKLDGCRAFGDPPGRLTDDLLIWGGE